MSIYVLPVGMIGCLLLLFHVVVCGFYGDVVSVCVVNFTGGCGVGVSDVYIEVWVIVRRLVEHHF